jgi:hypothetical protein
MLFDKTTGWPNAKAPSRGAREPTGEKLKVVRAEFLTLSYSVSQNTYNRMAYTSPAEPRVENSALKLVCRT